MSFGVDAARQDFRNNEDVYYDDKQYFAEWVREETLPAAAGMELSLEQIERWYQDRCVNLVPLSCAVAQPRCSLRVPLFTVTCRAKEIDETSGQLENALILIECGLRRGVKGLEAVHNELVTLSSLVYDDDEALQHTHTTPTAPRSDRKQQSHAIEARASSSNAFITFHRFHDLSDDAKLHLLLADSTDATLMRTMKTRALPFLQRLRKRNIDETSLLRQWMVSVAQGDRFHWCALIIQVQIPTPPPLQTKLKLNMRCRRAGRPKTIRRRTASYHLPWNSCGRHWKWFTRALPPRLTPSSRWASSSR